MPNGSYEDYEPDADEIAAMIDAEGWEPFESRITNRAGLSGFG